MAYYFPRPSEAAASTLDFRHLNSVGLAVRQGGPSQDSQKQAATQFEALFIQQLLKQARQASGMPGLLDSDQTRLAQSLADEQIAGQLANPGMGLAQALLRQMQAGQPGAEAQARIQERAAAVPELAASRLPGLTSRIGEERKQDAPSISALIKMLSASPLGEAAGAMMTAVRGAPSHIQSFVDRMGAAAKVASAQSGVPAKLILGQAALESGWGRREIRGEDGSNSYNLFGIKASPGWKGKVVNIMTTEYENGERRSVMQPFRAYGSYAESFADYARLISTNERYGGVLEASSAEDAARRIQEAGYATDPNYADKLISIMGYFRGLVS